MTVVAKAEIKETIAVEPPKIEIKIVRIDAIYETVGEVGTNYSEINSRNERNAVIVATNFAEMG